MNVPPILSAGAVFPQRGPVHLNAGPGAPGPWMAAVLRALVNDWLGAGARVGRFSARYLAAEFVGVEIIFGGSVGAVAPHSDGAVDMACVLWVRDTAGATLVSADCIATVADDPDDALPMDRLRQVLKVGEVAGTFVYRVESNDVEHFVKAIGGTAMPPGIAPTTYFAALDPVERRDLDLDDFLQHLPFPKSGGGNAFNEVEYERPIRVGDVITVSTRYTEAYEKRGSRGTLVFRIRINEMRDQNGELVATSRCGHVLSYRLPGQETK